MIVRHLNVDTLNIYLQMSSHFTLSLLFSSEEQYGTFYAIRWNISLENYLANFSLSFVFRFHQLYFIYFYTLIHLIYIERVVPKINIPPTVLELLAIDKDLEGKSHPFLNLNITFFPSCALVRCTWISYIQIEINHHFTYQTVKHKNTFLKLFFSFVCMNGNTWHHLCRCVVCNIGLKLDCRCLLR